MSYRFSILEDESRLVEIHSLTHDCLVDAGRITPVDSGMFILYPKLNEIEETTVLIVEYEGRIIGTNTITLDNKHGLHSEVHFPDQTDKARKRSKRLCSSWRIMIDKTHASITVLMGLIEFTLEVGRQLGVDACCFVFRKSHALIYQRLLGLEIRGSKQYMLDSSASNSEEMVFMFASFQTVEEHLMKRKKPSK
ncbi:MAG: hypothetical protein CMH49_08760 [Myxococcales bacterium]|nr:hypothetical protein [Myxococcales bacterium]